MGTRDTWLTRNAPGNALSVEYSGHVAYSQCSRRVLSAWAFGTCGLLAMFPEGGSRCGLRDTWGAPKVVPKEVPKGGLSGWLSGYVACSEGLRRGSFGVACSEGGLSGWLSLLDLGSMAGMDEICRGGVSSSKAGRRQAKGAAVAARRKPHQRRDGLKQVDEALAKNIEGLTGILATGLNRTEVKCKALATIHGVGGSGWSRGGRYGTQ